MVAKGFRPMADPKASTATSPLMGMTAKLKVTPKRARFSVESVAKGF
jgi:hypothetical protein